MAIFNNEFVINLSEPMNCLEHLFNVSVGADAKPGDYRIQVSLILPNAIMSGIRFNTSRFQDGIVFLSSQ